MLTAHLETTITQAPLGSLDDLSRDLWMAHANSLLTDDEAQKLAETIHHRRQAHRTGIPSASHTEASGAALGRSKRAWSYFPEKRLQRSPDKARSLVRRRTLAASGPLPPTLAANFTVSELAVCRIVSDEVRDKGTCVLTVSEIAARAGVGITKVRMALRIAASLGLIVVTERRVPFRPNLSNVVRIVSKEWMAWIARTKPKWQVPAPLGMITTKTVIPTRTKGEPSQKRRPRNHRLTDSAVSRKVQTAM